MKRYIFIISALFAAVTATAQDDISKQMEVTKAYTPKVGQADKLPVEPNMVDTVKLRPEIGYSITPTAWQTSFGSQKFSPAMMSVAPFEKHRPVYVRAGIGYPFQSTADLYFNPYMGSSSTFGLFFNHRGSYSKIENEMGIKPKSAEMLNGGGLWGSKHFRRYKLDGGLQYDNRMYNAYGVVPEDLFSYPSAALSIPEFVEMDAYNFGKIDGHIAFGDTFADLNHLNFQVGMNLGGSHWDSEFYQLDVDAWLKMAKTWRSKHGFEMGLYERGAIDTGDNVTNWNAVSVLFRPRYLLSLPKFSLRAGLDVDYIKNDMPLYPQNHIIIAPHLEMKLNIAKGYFTPYFTATSDIIDGSFEALSRRNPYNRSASATGWTQDFRLGFEGNLGSVFSYRIFGGFSWLEDYTVFTANQISYSDGTSAAYYNPLLFAPFADDGMKYTVGAEMGLSNLGGFSAKLGVNWNKVNFDWLPVGDLPKFDANVELAYSHKDKFTISAGTRILGEREFLNNGFYFTSGGSMETASVTTSISTVADVFAGMEVKILDGFNVFLEGRNLAGQKLYPYNYYRGLGANVMFGIKAVF